MAATFTIVLDVVNVWAIVFLKICGLVFVSGIRGSANSCWLVIFVFSSLLLCDSGFIVFVFSGFIAGRFDSVIVYIFLFDLAVFCLFWFVCSVLYCHVKSVYGTLKWGLVVLLCDPFKFFSELGLNTISKNIIILIFIG